MGPLAAIWRRIKCLRQGKRRLAHLGKSCSISPDAVFCHHENIEIGEHVYLATGTFLEGKGGIKIGNGTIIGPECVILSSSHNYRCNGVLPYGGPDIKKTTIIGCGVWLGYRVSICPGVKIGDGAVVGMGSVVARDIPAGDIVAGNPAKRISQRGDITQIKQAIAEESYYLKLKNSVSL